MGDFNFEIVYNERKYVCKLLDLSLYFFKNLRDSLKFCVGYYNYFYVFNKLLKCKCNLVKRFCNVFMFN